ncbi:methyltransferase [Stanieria cyanosphaera]|uniref:methyltransferase n=1 Tax=Stanieria cyanosphaera TaxID=102116 RepID=UPI0003100FF4|nr:methyltransferase [Stanieria cyanosphaera]
MFLKNPRPLYGGECQSVQTGNSAFEEVYGANIFAYLQQNSQAATIFEQSMTDFSFYDRQAVLAAYNFAEFKTVVDVGGGKGSLLAGILQKYPHLQGILFDEPYVVNKQTNC